MQNYVFNKSRDHSRNIKLFPFEKEGNKNILKSQNEIILPDYVDNFANIRRLTAKTSIQTNSAIFNGEEVDFDLQTPSGHLKNLYVEITLIELGGTTASTFNIFNVFNRLEVEVGGKLYHVFYPDELFTLQKIKQNFLEFNRVKIAEQLQGNYTPLSPSLTAGGSQVFLFPIPLWCGSQPDLRLLNQPPLLRFYFNSPASFVLTGSQNVGITQFNLLVEQIPTPIQDTQIDKWYRYQNWNRFIQTISLAPNSEYIMQLNTLMGYSAMLLFMIRLSPTATNATNWQNMQNILSSFELHDSSNNIIAISQYNLANLHIFNKVLPGDILDNHYTPFFYTIIHSECPDKSDEGMIGGGYQYSGRENLYLYTNSTMTAGNFEVTVWSSDYNMYCIRRDGSFDFTK